ncbi:sigma-70 family RNA polymerase sigma factor [Neobacillus rhizophilus]|uniref:Sigma-70 family RNA polymerase sigma factor n=1 Tax=Neobacillus rhizophilus TaxID=2833579 RepID=A0A942YXP2_9BACI|nr:sigma-70 family RNA polymerase sigma factor [Neobacillus rhizophilus]MBS4215310.1 sigma-70 family RNA polymerase sigma factor [Neobacillus rhizophilus]MBU8919615.1 sigma-70 family RNA polymerase sigma factor [Bacillus sp. FJAT-29953]
MELDQVYRDNVNDLYRYLYSLSKDHFIAEDLVQESFYRAYLHLEDYEISNIRAWLFKVAYHAFIDLLRKNKRFVIQEPKEERHSSKETPEKRLLEKESFQLLINDIHSLKEQEKHVLLLCDLHQLSYSEAAEILEMNLNTLKSHLHRGRKKVMEKVKERK